MPATAASRGLRDPFDPIASIGAQAALDVPVTKPHQRSPFVAGSAAAVARYDEAYQSARG